MSDNIEDSDEELPDGAKEVFEQMEYSTQLLLDAQHGTLSEEEQTRVLNLRGNTKAEALGHSYHLRDMLQENGYTAECEYIGLADDQPEWSDEQRHEIELRINHER